MAIETGIGGGSISLLKDETILDYRTGDTEFRKVDHLIRNISDLLKNNGIEKTEIGCIAYSEYPGSHMGLKIGASAVKGLRLAWNVSVSRKNLFECIADQFLPGAENDLIIFLPVSKTDLAWRVYFPNKEIFESGRLRGNGNQPQKLKMKFEKNATICAPLALIDDFYIVLKEFGLKKEIKIVDLGNNLSEYVGLRII